MGESENLDFCAIWKYNSVRQLEFDKFLFVVMLTAMIVAGVFSMRRKSDKDVLKENWWLLIGPLVFVILGILVIILTYIEKPIECTSLHTKAVTVEAFKHRYGSHGSSYDYIRTSDGERYTISGEYQQKQLEELLKKGTKITIKWYQNKPFRTLLAEEIYIDGIRVVAYDNDVPVDKTITLIAGICSILLGLGSFCFIRFILATLSEKTKKHVKTKRKYSKVKKIAPNSNMSNR